MERRQRVVQIVATLVTVVLAALVVIGLTSTRLGGRPGTAASSAPIAAHDYGPPPADIDLLYVHDPDHPGWLTGMDWSGTPRATVKLDATTSGAQMAPDGHIFAIGLNAKGGAWQFLDGLGTPIAAPSTLAGALLPMWADDSRHVCSTTLDQQTLNWTLWTELPGQAPKQVRVVATDATLGETMVRVVACSFKNDLAIAERITQSWPSEHWLIRISDGAVLRDEKGGGAALAGFTASADTTLLAENSSLSIGETGDNAPSTLVVRAADGSVVSTLDPSMGVLAFNGDDSTALVTLTPWTGDRPVHLGIVDLQSGHLVWQDNTNPFFFGQFVAEPGGKSFAIAYPATNTYPSLATIVIVGPSGVPTALDRAYTPAW